MQSYDFSSLFGTQKRIDNLPGLSQLRQYTDQQRKVSRMLQDNFATSSATKTMADRLMGTIDTSAMNNAVAAQLKAAIPPDASQLMAERFRKSLGTATFGNQLAAQMPKVALPDSYLDVLRKQTFAFQNSAAYKQLLAGIDLGKMQMMLGQADLFREAVLSEAAEVADENGLDVALARLAAQREQVGTILAQMANAVSGLVLLGVVRIPDEALGMLILFSVMVEAAIRISNRGDADDEEAA